MDFAGRNSIANGRSATQYNIYLVPLKMLFFCSRFILHKVDIHIHSVFDME